MKPDFEELKFNTEDLGNVSLFGAFPSSLVIRFVLCIHDGEYLSPDEVYINLHADEWNKSYNKSVKIPLTHDRAGSSSGESRYFADVKLSELLAEYDLLERGSGLFYYSYIVTAKNGTAELGGELPTALEPVINHVGERQLLLYSPDFTASRSFRRGPVYQIFVDRFSKSENHDIPPKPDAVLDPDWDNGIPQYGAYPGADVENNVFFGGNLYGIAEKLDYISSLGVTTIYLSPIFDAHSNHKYDTGDYLSVDPMFGGDEAFFYLCQRAREYGIDVILDGVFNHTGDDSVYFNRPGKYNSLGAYQSKASVYYDWYTFRHFPDDYECWWNVKILPRVDSSNLSYRDFIENKVVAKWMNGSRGASGWRLDVADELSDEFLYGFRSAVRRESSDAVIIGEVWEDASDKVSYGKRREYLYGKQLDSVMNYPLRDAVISYVLHGDVMKLRRATECTYRRYPKESSDTLLNFLGTHDTERILSVFGEADAQGKSNAELSVMRLSTAQREAAIDRLRLAYTLICGLFGVPCIFYGDEAGLEGYHDPFCRRPFPWNNIESRLLEHYRRIGQIRRDYPVFRDGLFKLLYLSPNALAYIRLPYMNDSQDAVLFIICRLGECRASLPNGVKPLYGTGEIIAGELKLKAMDFAVFSLAAQSGRELLENGELQITETAV